MSLRENNKIKTRARILRTARYMFRERGYEDTMVGDIADAAEVSRQTLYNYFPNKESLLIGIANAEMQSLEESLQNNTAENVSIIAKIRSLLEEYIMDSVAYLSLARRIAFNVVENESVLSDTQNRIKQLLSPLVESAKEEGAISKEIPTEAAVDALLGIYYVILFESPKSEPLTEADFKRRISRLLDIVLTGLS